MMDHKKTVLLCYTALEYDRTGLNECTSLFYLAGALERSGYQVHVYHDCFSRLSDAIRRLKPDALGFSCDAENQHLLTKAIPFVRNLYEGAGITGLPVVVGGPQAPGLGKDFMDKASCDYILRGEGEETLPALLDYIFHQKGELSLIPGLCYQDEGGYHETPGPAIIEHLETLPRPAYHTSLHKRRSYGSVIFTGRGCPFSCAFCASSVSHTRMRLRPMEDVLAEIRENLLRRPDMRVLVIQDDTFCLDPVRIRTFCQGMREIRKINPVVWFCETHVKTLLSAPELLREMIESGLVRLQIGMESGDPEVLKKYNKNVTPEEILALVKLAAELGLPQIAGNFIVGGPKEEKGVTEAFIRTLLRTGAGIVDINTGFLRNYPGTAISRDPAAYGLKEVLPGMTAGDDYPSMIPVDETPEEVIRERQLLNRAIREETALLLASHSIPDERILKQLELKDLGINSRWSMEISMRERLLQYYKTLYEKEGIPFPADPDPSALYPQRTFEFYRTVILQDGVPYLDREALSPLEYQLLFYASGKFTVLEIMERLWPDYRDAYSSKEELLSMILEFYRQADRRYLVSVYSYPVQTIAWAGGNKQTECK